MEQGDEDSVHVMAPMGSRRSAGRVRLTFDARRSSQPTPNITRPQKMKARRPIRGLGIRASSVMNPP
jgi:hypothetical protein